MSALVVANGSANVVAIPTASAAFPCVVIRRILSGSAAVSRDEPFQIESFSEVTAASTRFQSIRKDQSPLLVTSRTERFSWRIFGSPS